MSENPLQHPSGLGEQRHHLDGIRLRLPVPKGRHASEVMASFGQWLARRHELEPFDLEVFDSPTRQSGVLSMRLWTPEKKLDAYIERSRAAVQCADSMAVSCAMLHEEAKRAQRRAQVLASEGHRQREASKQLRAATAALRRESAERSRASIVRTLTGHF